MNEEQSSTRILAKAYEIMGGGRNWTPGTYAQTRTGASCAPESAAAIRFCAMGALQRARHLLGTTIGYTGAVARLARAIGIKDQEPYSIETWNDSQASFGPIRAAYLAAIENGK